MQENTAGLRQGSRLSVVLPVPAPRAAETRAPSASRDGERRVVAGPMVGEMVAEPPHEEAAVALTAPLTARPMGAGDLQQTRQPADVELVAAGEVHGGGAGQRCPEHGFDLGGPPLDVGLDYGGVEVLDVLDVQDGALVAFVGWRGYLFPPGERGSKRALPCAPAIGPCRIGRTPGFPRCSMSSAGPRRAHRPCASRAAPICRAGLVAVVGRSVPLCKGAVIATTTVAAMAAAIAAAMGTVPVTTTAAIMTTAMATIERRCGERPQRLRPEGNQRRDEQAQPAPTPPIRR